MTDTNYNEKFFEAVVKGDAASAEDSLRHGADVNCIDKKGYTGLITAAYNNNKAMVVLLLEWGADPAIVCNQGTALDWARKNNARETERLLIMPCDEIVFSRTLVGKTLQEVFNFFARERISLLRSEGMFSPVEAMTRESFDALDEKVVRKAFAEYKKRGGELTEDDVFPGKVFKPRISGIKGLG